VRPALILCLGAMAAQAVFGASFRITRERGRWIEVGAAQRALATWHPSAVLRARDVDRERLRTELVEDLRALAQALA